MFDSLFKGLFDSEFAVTISVKKFLLCIGVSLVLGIIMAVCYVYRKRYTKSFVIALAMLPVVVCVVIMMVNGNVGTGVAVAGAFGLVRFRSAPGTAEEIGALFIAMGTGLITGMGYLGFACLYTIIMCVVLILLNFLDFGEKKRNAAYKTLSITIPENLNYSGVFDDIFSEHTVSCELTQVKTTNMGSMFRLTYDVVLRDVLREKEFIDKLRCRNGNLEITVSNQSFRIAEL